MLSANVSKRLGAIELEFRLEVPSGGMLVVVGRSGAGKTSLLDILAGLSHPGGGTITLDGAVLFDGERGISVPPHERPIGYVFQDYALFPHLTVAGNVGFGLRAQGLPRAEVAWRVAEVLDQLGIADLQNRRPGHLSGGERQRAALARALVLRPRLLLLDEPLSTLDPETHRGVHEELRRIVSSLPCVTVFVTHDPFEAIAFGERIAVMETGRIVQVESRERVREGPRSGYLAELMRGSFGTSLE